MTSHDPSCALKTAASKAACDSKVEKDGGVSMGHVSSDMGSDVTDGDHIGGVEQ